MKININPKKELFKWGPIKFRMAYTSPFMDVILVHVPKYYPWPWPPSLSIFRNGRMVWITEALALGKEGLKYFKKYFLNLKNHQKHWQRWKDWVEYFYQEEKRLKKLDFKKLTKQEFARELKKFYKLNIDFWLITHVLEIANWGGEYLLKNKLRRLFKEKTNYYLEILSAPVKPSFFQQEELDLLKIAFIKNKKERNETLIDHVKNYHWLLNNYGDGSRRLKKDYFVKKLKELTKEKKAQEKIREIENVIKRNKTRKARLIKRLKLSKELALITEQLSQSIWWQDLRKSYIWRILYLTDKFLNEMARRTSWKFSELQWCWVHELIDITESKRVNKKVILQRGKYYAFIGERGELKEFWQERIVKKLIKLYLDVDIKHVKEIRGLAVSRGKQTKICGRVKVIRNPLKETKKMKKGDILVAGMTSPEYIVVMRKAAAIITDHGGMTAHAAIISRELNIPCIVKTQIATKVLKDGDLVEVDANKGVVRILKKK